MSNEHIDVSLCIEEGGRMLGMLDEIFGYHKIQNHHLWQYGPPDERLDFTEVPIWARIPTVLKTTLWASANAHQYDQGVDFERDDIVVHYQRDFPQEVIRVPNRHIPTMPRYYVETRGREGGYLTFEAGQILQLGYLIAAYMPYYENLHVIQAETTQEAIARMAIVLANLNIIK